MFQELGTRKSSARLLSLGSGLSLSVDSVELPAELGSWILQDSCGAGWVGLLGVIIRTSCKEEISYSCEQQQAQDNHQDAEDQGGIIALAGWLWGCVRAGTTVWG